ncbi:MAG: UDP-2,3-diacylglucosamine diphosphatase [Proteobacteria bacterium]|jgi:UDP-2,3-diacylglucosamine hydrolase|nr:UDP-2,3-diacylglucosamine diphosphatase [Pseudomonadota bacterium]
MSTLFISDLHLTPERPASTEYFVEFMRLKASSANTIYVLGDLFEYWIGDDASSILGADPVISEFKRLADAGTQLFFMPGNRDFLVGDALCDQAGFQYLADQTLVTLNTEPALLLHGDSLCTDDIEHQQFRAMVNNANWQTQFLELPIETRIEYAHQARTMSNSNDKNYSDEIMDVTESGVADAFQDHAVKLMIHGHTHRPNIHKHRISGTDTIRIVLGDWYEQASYLELDDGTLKLHIGEQVKTIELLD